MERCRIECHHMIQRLHDDATVVHPCSGTIDKSLVGHIILVDIRLYSVHITVVHIQVRDTKAGANPYIMTGILHHSMHHLVPQPVLTPEDTFFTVLHLQLQSSVKTRPLPSATVRKLTVHMVTIWP